MVLNSRRFSMLLNSLGTYAPPHSVTLEDRHQVAEQFVHGSEKDKWFVPYIFEKSKVSHRHSVLLNASSGDLRERQNFFSPATQYTDGLGPTTGDRMKAYDQHAAHAAHTACHDAFQTSTIAPADITHLVTASCTGFSAPGFDLALIDLLDLPRDVARTHLGFMGCHAGLNCLRTANAYVAADPQAKVLVCTVELCSLHFQYGGGNDQKIANAIFADGAGAAIVTNSPADENRWRTLTHGSYVLPKTVDLMTWRIEDHGFAMGLSEQIPNIIETHIKDWLASWLARHEVGVDDINTWAVHPGGPQILIAFQAALELDRSQLETSWQVLNDYGNMSSATIFFVLKQLIDRQAPRPCVAIGFGPGLTIEACLFV